MLERSFVYITGMDGNLWYCHGPDFINLQVSACFFAEHEEDAVLEYLKYAVGVRYS